MRIIVPKVAEGLAQAGGDMSRKLNERKLEKKREEGSDDELDEHGQ